MRLMLELVPSLSLYRHRRPYHVPQSEQSVPRSHSTWVLVDPPIHVPLPCATIRAVGAQVAQHMGAGAVRLIVEARLSGEQAYGQVLAVIAHPVLGLRV